ncbi:hypothetical protein WJX77_008761 [Trebouxia sp. C0004]
MKRYMNMSDEELKELQFAILVELQKLGTSVPVLVGEALLATDKRHCAALSAILREGQYLAMASIFRTICKAAGHQKRLEPAGMYPAVTLSASGMVLTSPDVQLTYAAALSRSKNLLRVYHCWQAYQRRVRRKIDHEVLDR